MGYRESQLDQKLRKWFANDLSKALLRRLRLSEGSMRGITPFSINFDYPIAAFAGINGAGKSTLLAMVACAFHAPKEGFKLAKRQRSYYTFSDFFVQHAEEKSPEGIKIYYAIAYDDWTPSPGLPEGKGIGWQFRKKNVGGKWNDYETRAERTVIYLGIDRIVPPQERSQSRSYSKAFSASTLKGWEKKVMQHVGAILGKSYDDYRYLQASKYSLPIVKSGGITYSGFNMGAGENALFELFSAIYAAGGSPLIVVDEIELGLHFRAQKLFMRELKTVCEETGAQIVCTTHSKEIFDSLPDDGRFFVETVGGKTKITPGMASEYAFAKMGGPSGTELEIYVEDMVARAILQTLLPAATRARLKIVVIGSALAVARQMSAAFVRNYATPVLAVFDGDQRAKEKNNTSHAKAMAEDHAKGIEEWIAERIGYIPGATWPERWMIEKLITKPEVAAKALDVEADVVMDILESARHSAKHSEFYDIAALVGLDEETCLSRVTFALCAEFPVDFAELKAAVTSKLT